MEKVMCDFCDENEASPGDSYRFKPICEDCLLQLSPRYRKYVELEFDDEEI